MKLSFCTNGSIRVRNTCAASGPLGSAFTSTSFSPSVPVRARLVGLSPKLLTASKSSSIPTSALEEQHRMGISEPAATAWTASLARASSEGTSPSKYFSITSSSTSIIDSINASRISLGSTKAPSASLGCKVLTTPFKSPPCPIGTLSNTHWFPHTSRIDSTTPSNSILSPSILLMTTNRPTPALPASAKTRRVLTSIPD